MTNRTAPILPPPPDAPRALLLVTLARLQAGQGLDLHEAIVSATLRTCSPPAVVHRATTDLLGAKDERGEYRFSLFSGAEVAPALADWLGVSDTERAPAPPAARDTVECAPLFAEMDVTCGDESEAA